MAKVLGVTPRFHRFGDGGDDSSDDEDDAIESYPSVTFGAIDITKATRHLGECLDQQQQSASNHSLLSRTHITSHQVRSDGNPRVPKTR